MVILCYYICVNNFTLSVGGHRARNRWLVAYTLLKNPSLVKHTAANIQQTRAAAESKEKEDSQYLAPSLVPAS